VDQLVHRVAEVRLRGRVGSPPAHAYWPAPASATPGLLVFFGGTDEQCRALCAAGGVVLLSVTGTATVEHATSALDWVADHGAELGADPDRLLVGGAGAGCGLAAAVALYARDQGWPVITRHLLIDPLPDVWPDRLGGVAPATVISSNRDDTARLRDAGVEVTEAFDLTTTLW
jgi:acetyl esterase